MTGAARSRYDAASLEIPLRYEEFMHERKLVLLSLLT